MRTLLAIAASILIMTCLAGWALFLKQKEPLVAQTAVLDLRNRSVTRGTEPNPAEPPLEVSRAAKEWNIYLPLGSSEGPYDVRIVEPSGEPLVEVSGAAKLNDRVTSLRVIANVSSAHSGRYTLQVRKASSGWNSYALVLQ